jgi:hypothetical protein
MRRAQGGAPGRFERGPRLEAGRDGHLVNRSEEGLTSPSATFMPIPKRPSNQGLGGPWSSGLAQSCRRGARKASGGGDKLRRIRAKSLI